MFDGTENGFSNVESKRIINSLFFSDSTSLTGAERLLYNRTPSQIEYVKTSLYLTKQIVSIYAIENQEELMDYLVRHQHLLPVLLEIPLQVKKFMPEHLRLVLKYMKDPEEGDESVIVKVVTDLEVDEAINKMDSFGDEWWLNQPNHLIVDVCVTLDFV